MVQVCFARGVVRDTLGDEDGARGDFYLAAGITTITTINRSAFPLRCHKNTSHFPYIP